MAAIDTAPTEPALGVNCTGQPADAPDPPRLQDCDAGANDPGLSLVNDTGPVGVTVDEGSRFATVAVQVVETPTRTEDGVQATVVEVAPLKHTTNAVPVGAPPPVPTPAPKNVYQPEATPPGTSGLEMRGTWVPRTKEKPPPTAAVPDGHITETLPALVPKVALEDATLVEKPEPDRHTTNDFTRMSLVSRLTPKNDNHPDGVPLVTSGLDCLTTFVPPVSKPPPMAVSLPLQLAVTPPAGLPTHTTTRAHAMVRSFSTT